MKFIRNSSLIVFTMLTSSLFAQDLLMFKDGREAEVKVTEVSATEVKYKRFDNLDGPVYSVPRAELFMVKYKNGQKEVMQANGPTPAASPTNTQPTASGSVLSSAAEENAARAAEELKEYRLRKAQQEYDELVEKKKKTLVQGAVMTPIGFGLVAAGSAMYGASLQSAGEDWAVGIAGLCLAIVGLPIAIVGAVKLGRHSSFKRKLNSMERPTAHITPSFIHFSGHHASGVGSASGVGATLSIRF